MGKKSLFAAFIIALTLTACPNGTDGDIPPSVSAIAAGHSHTVALKSDGTVWAWGSNLDGQLGDGTTIHRYSPVQVKGSGGAGFLTGVSAVAAGYSHTVALKSDGTVWAWGWNSRGQLGDGTGTNSNTPVQVKGAGGAGFLDDVSAIAAGSEHTVALKSDGTVWTWGLNNRGQLGNGTDINSATPVQVRGSGGAGFLTGVSAIAAGFGHTVALKSDGTVWTWGHNTNGQLGDGTSGNENNRNTPVQVKGSGGEGSLTNVSVIAAGSYHTVALETYVGCTVWAWGNNPAGQLGDGTNGLAAWKSSPVIVKGAGDESMLSGGVYSVAAGSSHTVALKSDGTVWA